MKKILFLALCTALLPISIHANPSQMQEKLDRLENELTQLQRLVYQKTGTLEGNDSIPALWEKVDAQEIINMIVPNIV